MSNYIADFRNGAVNPYNFVSLGSGVERNAPSSGNISGVIHCSMKNATPLALPDLPNVETELVKTENGKLDEHKKAPFFKIGGKPVITGSEIRGVIRSAYETLSNSCLSVNNNNILSARSSDVRTAGIIRYENEDKKWHLYKADTRKLKYDGSEDFDETANTFKRTWKNYKYIKGANGKSRADYKGGKIPVSYKFSTSFEEVEVDDLDLSVEDYNTVCKMYSEKDSSIKKFIITPSKDGKSYPVYYREFSDDGKKYVWLSPAQISRSVFRKKVDDLLGSYRHCDDTNNVCEACGLFGMIGKKGSEPSAIASRLRFTDAKSVNEPQLTYKTLKELSSPRLSSIEFYSTAPNMKYQWNYDTKGVKLNGRKYYFHHSCDCTTPLKTCRNLTTELIDKGAKFSFDVFFDKLTENELKRLVWTLAIGENSADGHQLHKLGHGKPLGLGSVKITVDSVVKRSFDPEKMAFADENMNVDAFFEKAPFDESSEYFKEYMAVTDFDYLEGKPVAYPYGDDKAGKETSVGTLVWFKANHNDGKMVKPGEACPISYHLPKITDKNNLVLPALTASDDYGKNTSSGNKEKSKSGYTGPTSFGDDKPSNSDTATFKCRKCGTINEVQKNKPFAKPNSLIICKKCKNKFYEKY